MKNNVNSKQVFKAYDNIKIALFKNANDPEKRKLLKKLEFQPELREHIADVVRSIRELNKVRTGEGS